MVIFLALSCLLFLPVLTAIDWTAASADMDQLAAAVAEPSWMDHAAGMVGVWAGVWWAYFAIGWGLLGATPGKWLLGLRIVDHRGRYPIGLVRATLRLAAYSVSSLTLCWGHLLPLFRGDGRALHDILAGTLVVRGPVVRTSEPREETRQPETGTPEDAASG
jgi:uncharacterized RDD family membrane protein YckC